MEDIKTIDIMNYPNQIKEIPYNFNDWEEWRKVCTTTFKPFFPLGRFPQTPEELEKHKHLFGTAFYPYETLDDFIAAMDKEGYDRVCISAVKMWSYRTSFKLIFDFTIDQVNDLVKRSKGRIIGAAGYNPFRIKESLEDIEKAVKEYGFKFVYLHSISFGIPFNDKKLYPLYGLCDALNVPVSVQAGHSAEALPSWVGNPMDMDEVVMDFPHLKINLSHTGYPWIDEWMDLVWKHENVYGDISAYMPDSLDPKLLAFIGSGKGNSKVMWGTNGLGLGHGKHQIMKMDMKDKYKENILRNNALRFLGLES